MNFAIHYVLIFLSLSIQVIISVIRVKCHVHTIERLKGWGEGGVLTITTILVFQLDIPSLQVSSHDKDITNLTDRLS